MITIGFTGQLKGWWDNYLSQDQRDKVILAVKQEGEQFTQNAVYTLVLNIIEHFSERWSDNSETIRTLLQNLRCKMLTSFRVKKAIRGENHCINYDDYTYGKLISACVQEGLALCNEIKLNQQIKRHRLNERKQLGEFCEQFTFDIPKHKSKDKEDTPHKKKKSSKKDYEKWKKKRIEKKLRRAEEGKIDSSKRKKKYHQHYNKSDTCHKCGRFGHYAKDCRVKEKIKSLDIEGNIKDFLYKIMLNSDSGKSDPDSSSSESSTSEDLKALQQEDYLTPKDECSPCQQGMACEKNNEEDDLYKIYDQFKELSLNVIDNDKVLELLQNIKDPEIRAQIIDKIGDSREKDQISEKDHISKEIPTKEGSYAMAEVKNLLLERRKMISSPTTINDLKEEVNNLKEDIIRLKEKNVVIEKNPEGKIHGQEIIDLINVKISKYYKTATMEPQVMEGLSPFKKITRKLQMKKGLISKSEAIALYMEEVKKDLLKNLDLEIKDDISIALASHTNEEDDTCIVGEGQDVDEEEIDIETILKRYQQQIEESFTASTTGKGKEKT
ncbi:hypothetical protein H5410_004696 [Solanum commersonii]|uniref:CCHC-type domain-containing protein n=1 Tax=Solanum commersonii TaxID=4109 RepID=A0A9J6B8Q5_SOLCO|nr:hypothetical protein H5410_004696 [Solanum commersonii]